MSELRNVVLDGKSLSLNEIVAVSRRDARVELSDDPLLPARLNASRAYVDAAVAQGLPIYGVTTSFGGLAHRVISPEEAAAHQNNAVRALKCGAGAPLPRSAVRASMLLRVNSHLHGASGVRRELIDRVLLFLNESVTPIVPELGSIGASGDVVPLDYIAGAATGADDAFAVDFAGETIGARVALDRLGVAPLPLLPKETLAMINGTSVMTGIARELRPRRRGHPVALRWARTRCSSRPSAAPTSPFTRSSTRTSRIAASNGSARLPADAARRIDVVPRRTRRGARPPRRRSDPGSLLAALPAAVPRTDRRRPAIGSRDRSRSKRTPPTTTR